jgi:site-specific DNA-methyltransferase (adenine-specific)
MVSENTLYYGDNLDILRRYIKDESVDLIYLDPPFNSNRSYNVLFKDETGAGSDAQITAFDDAWHWGETAERTYQELIQNAPMNVATMIDAMRQFIGRNQMMAYLVMMAARLVELHRVLKPTGSLYLHCDSTASHYLKILLDMIFNPQNFRNEIIWKRRSGSNSSVHQANRFGTVTDTILFYSKTDQAIINPQYNFEAEGYQDYIDKFFKFVDKDGRKYQIDNLANPAPRPNLMYEYKGYKPPKNGWAISKEKMEQWDKEGRIYFPENKDGRLRRKRFLDELQGKPVQNLWDDIEMISSQSNERLGYQTQKPVALLERIINASSNPGDLVLDPFSGCGTCISAAQKLGRRWIGIDITHLAIAMHKNRLKGNFGLEPKRDYQVIGEPEDLAGAHQLARDDRYQFQWWALSLVKARPLGGSEGSREGKKGSDKGIDGYISFLDDARGNLKRAVVQVKSGHVNSSMIRDLKGTVEREQAQIGIFITLDPPSRDMVTEAVSAGQYHSELWNKDYPCLQILSVEELLAGADAKIPPTPDNAAAFKKAGKVEKAGPQQGQLGI